MSAISPARETSLPARLRLVPTERTEPASEAAEPRGRAAGGAEALRAPAPPECEFSAEYPVLLVPPKGGGATVPRSAGSATPVPKAALWRSARFPRELPLEDQAGLAPPPAAPRGP